MGPDLKFLHWRGGSGGKGETGRIIGPLPDGLRLNYIAFLFRMWSSD